MKLVKEKKHWKNLKDIREYLKQDLDSLTKTAKDLNGITSESELWEEINFTLNQLERVERYMVNTKFTSD